MPATAAIRKFKPHLVTGAVVSALCFVAELLYLRKIGEYQLTSATDLWLLLPPFGVFLFGLPLTYLDWFGQPGVGLRRIYMLAFYWAIVAGTVLVFSQAASIMLAI